MTDMKQKIAAAFEEMGMPVPDSMKEEKKISKADQKLIHVVTHHLYFHVLQHLDAAAEHLAKLAGKGDERAEEASKAVNAINSLTVQVINALAESVEELPNVEEMDALMENLQKEFENASLLKIMDVDVPKEKMH